MTIKEYATQHGISTQAIYQRLQREGIATATLSDPRTRQLTPEGENILDSYYNQHTENQVSNEKLIAMLKRQLADAQEAAERAESDSMDKLKAAEENAAQAEIKASEAMKRAAAQEQANEVLSVKLAAAEERAAMLAAERDRLAAQVDKLMERVPRLEAGRDEREQLTAQVEQLTRRLEEQENLTIWQRIFRRK